MSRSGTVLWVYLVAPLAGLAVFAGYYGGFRSLELSEQAERERVAEAEAALHQAKQAELEAILERQSEALQEAKAKALADKEEAARRARAARIDSAQRELDDLNADISRLNRQLEELGAKLADERATRGNLEESFAALAIEVAKLRANKDAADLETQRLAKMVALAVGRELAAAKSQVDERLSRKR